MKKTILFMTFVTGFTYPVISSAQTYIGHYLKKSNIIQDTLLDNTTGVKYILDKQRIYIKAIDKDGKQLWRTDPVKDNKLEEYRIKRPKVVYFRFEIDRSNNRKVININYDNSQAGYLDKKNGKFFFRGQD